MVIKNCNHIMNHSFFNDECVNDDRYLYDKD
jgi:hypothetical protein